MLAEEFSFKANQIIGSKGNLNVALSGGNTPKLLFEILAAGYKTKIDWSKINFYWVDERCVPPDSAESNFKMTNDELLKKVNVPDMNIHRMRGEVNPETEAESYSVQLSENLPSENNIPVFDIIFLGMGKDGHTASIFPGQLNLFDVNEACSASENPQTHQKRITLTGKVINNADYIYFLVTGKDKSEVIRKIIERLQDYDLYPAAHVNPVGGSLNWYIDDAAAELFTKVKNQMR